MSHSDRSDDIKDFKRRNLRVAVHKKALVQLDEDVIEGLCVDIDGKALAVEVPLHTVQHGQTMIVNVDDFYAGEKLKIQGTVNRVDVFTSNLTGEDTLLIVCQFSKLDSETKSLIDEYISQDTVDVASW